MLAVLTSALLLILAFPPFDAGWAAWIAFIPCLLDLQQSTPRRAFLRGALTGFLFFLGTVWWVLHVTLVGMLFLVAYLALFFGAWGWFAQRVIPVRSSRVLLFLLPAGWVLLEYLRSVLLSGFGWNLLAHTQWNWIRLIQIADAAGVWGVSFLVVLGNVALWQALGSLRGRLGFAWRPLLLAAVVVAVALGYGTFRLQPPKDSAPFKVALLQGNIPQSQKWDEAFQESIWKRYEQLTAEAVKRNPDLIVWPETSVPGFLEEPQIHRRLAGMVEFSGKATVVGVPTEEEATGSLYNSAVLLGPDGNARARYHKVHLVPFGEFIPLQPVLGWLNNVVPIGDFSAGSEFTVFSPGAPARPFSVLICFEDLFPSLSRRFVRAGAEGLLVITNDGWFGRSAASLQHLQSSVFRAVEGRVWVGRAANTGWTGFIDPWGRRLPPPGQVPRFRPGVAEAELKVSERALSPYARWGDWLPLLCLGLAGWALFPSRRRL